MNRGLKHRPDGAVRIIPVPPVLIRLLRQHIRESGTARVRMRGGLLSLAALLITLLA